MRVHDREAAVTGHVEPRVREDLQPSHFLDAVVIDLLDSAPQSGPTKLPQLLNAVVFPREEIEITLEYTCLLLQRRVWIGILRALGFAREQQGAQFAVERMWVG